MWSEGGTELFIETFYTFSVTAVCLPRRFELLAVSSGQAEGGSSQANLSKHLAPAQAMARPFGRMIYCCSHS